MVISKCEANNPLSEVSLVLFLPSVVHTDLHPCSLASWYVLTDCDTFVAALLWDTESWHVLAAEGDICIWPSTSHFVLWGVFSSPFLLTTTGCESGLQTLRAGASAAVLFSRSPSGVGKRLVPFWLRLTVRVQAFGVPAPWEMVSYETSHLNELSSLLYDAGFTRNSLGIPLTSLCVPSFTWIFFFFFRKLSKSTEVL